MSDPSGGKASSARPRQLTMAAGFVIGGSTPAATAADMLAVGWDQNAFNPLMSPAAEAAERAAGGWVKDLLGLPGGASVGFVTGAQAANTVGIACGRHWVLDRAGWDVETEGLIGAPRVRVVSGFERHATIDRSLRLLGLGTASFGAVPAPLPIEDLLAGSQPGTPTPQPGGAPEADLPPGPMPIEALGTAGAPAAPTPAPQAGTTTARRRRSPSTR